MRVGDRRRGVVQAAARPVGLGALALAIGVLVYLTDRDPAHAAWIPRAWSLSGPALFGAIGGWLPSLTHAFAFSLFTATVTGSRPTAPAYGACVLWWAIDSAFELAQAPGLSRPITSALAASPAPPWLTDPVSSYLIRGRFDWADLLAIAAGAVAAGAVLHRLRRREARS